MNTVLGLTSVCDFTQECLAVKAAIRISDFAGDGLAVKAEFYILYSAGTDM